VFEWVTCFEAFGPSAGDTAVRKRRSQQGAGSIKDGVNDSLLSLFAWMPPEVSIS
jgi:hypothetical protein